MSDSKITRRSRRRARAALTGTSFDFIRMEVPCPKCGKDDLQPLAELEANSTTTCRYCGHLIDVSTPNWRSRIALHTEIHKKLKPM